MTQAHARVLILSGAYRAKGHDVPEALLAAEWKAVDKAKTASARRLAAAVEPVLLEAAMAAATTRAVNVELLTPALLRVLSPAVVDALRAGFGSGLARVSARLPFDADAPAVREAVERIVGLAESVPATLAGRVETIVRDGLAAGQTYAEIGDAIRAAVPEMTANQAAVVGRTTAGQAFEAGQAEAFTAAGVERKRWLSMRDGAVRPEHAELDGEEVAMGESFSNGEDYPSSINCRCTVLPVVPGKAARKSQRGRPWLAERNAAIVRDYPGLRDAHGREVALDTLGKRHSIAPDTVWTVWKNRAR